MCLERCLVEKQIFRIFTTAVLKDLKRILIQMKQAPVLILMMTAFSFLSSAQQTRFITDPQASFNQAKEYFQKEQYSLAYPILKDLQQRQRETERSNDALNYQDVRYYTTVCALKQNEERAVYAAQEFIDLEDNAARVQMMSYHLA